MLKTPTRSLNQDNIFQNGYENDILNSKGNAIDFSDSEKIHKTSKILKDTDKNIIDDLLSKYDNKKIIKSQNLKSNFHSGNNIENTSK